ncbi:hypothetical protein LJC18_00810 [Lachnospiraceae bacterium OttesenSCG-928-E19]|nr:hypothetical protein [Lachnospiraceae bacterium OttesenSCG-928-E19]
MNKYIPSKADIVQRVLKTSENPHGVKPAYYAPVTKPALLILGGSGTKLEKNANNYAARLETLLKENNINDVNIYSVFYNFNSHSPFLDRINLFRRAGRKITLADHENQAMKVMMENEPKPEFVTKLFNIFIRPRIADSNNERLDCHIATRNINQLKIFIHCYGSSVIRFIEEMMISEMNKIGYKQHEIQSVMKNLLVIAHTPSAPIGKSAFTYLSFASAMDQIVNHHNLFHKYVKQLVKFIKPCFFPEPYGNFFLVARVKKDKPVTDKEKNNQYDDEHETEGLVNRERHLLTPDGNILFTAEANAIVNGLNAAISGEALPKIADLVSGNGVDFEEMKHNGEMFIKQMLPDLRAAMKIVRQRRREAAQK